MNCINKFKNSSIIITNEEDIAQINVIKAVDKIKEKYGDIAGYHDIPNEMMVRTYKTKDFRIKLIIEEAQGDLDENKTIILNNINGIILIRLIDK